MRRGGLPVLMRRAMRIMRIRGIGVAGDGPRRLIRMRRAACLVRVIRMIPAIRAVGVFRARRVGPGILFFKIAGNGGRHPPDVCRTGLIHDFSVAVGQKPAGFCGAVLSPPHCPCPDVKSIRAGPPLDIVVAPTRSGAQTDQSRLTLRIDILKVDAALSLSLLSSSVALLS